MLQDLNFRFFEEPCPWEEVGETKKVADALDIPIAFGEQNSSLWGFEWMMQTGVMQIVQPDLNYNGGFIAGGPRRADRRASTNPDRSAQHADRSSGSKIIQFAGLDAQCRRIYGVSMEGAGKGGRMVFTESNDS